MSSNRPKKKKKPRGGKLFRGDKAGGGKALGESVFRGGKTGGGGATKKARPGRRRAKPVVAPIERAPKKHGSGNTVGQHGAAYYNLAWTKNDLPALVIKAGARSIKRYHPTVHRDEVLDRFGDPEHGERCEVYSERGKLIGRGLYHHGGKIATRIMTRSRRAINRGFLREKIQAAIALRATLGLPNEQTNAYRVVFGEGDGLPGIVVDRYADCLVIQLHGAASVLRRDVIAVLREELNPVAICDRSPFRAGPAWVLAPPPEKVWVRELGLTYQLDPASGMKTGHFCDQRDNRALLRTVARGRTVLDLFCFTGAFAMNAAAAGAVRVVGVDQAEPACAAARKNAITNRFADRVTFRVDDGFALIDELTRQDGYDLIVLDPPALAKQTRSREAALAAYHHLNKRALMALPDGGFLLTCSCTQQVSADALLGVVREAAASARATVRVVGARQQPGDHPIALHTPETSYLKGFLLQVTGRSG